MIQRQGIQVDSISFIRAGSAVSPTCLLHLEWNGEMVLERVPASSRHGDQYQVRLCA